MPVKEAGRVGKRGTLVIPAKLRRIFGIEEGSELIAEETPEGILLRPLETWRAAADAPTTSVLMGESVQSTRATPERDLVLSTQGSPSLEAPPSRPGRADAVTPARMGERGVSTW